MDKSSKKQINKRTLDLKYTLDEMAQTNTYRIFLPIATECTFFSIAYGILPRADHMLSHKKSPSKFKMIEIIPSIFSKHNGMKLGTGNRKKTGKFENV